MDISVFRQIDAGSEDTRHIMARPYCASFQLLPTVNHATEKWNMAHKCISLSDRKGVTHAELVIWMTPSPKIIWSYFYQSKYFRLGVTLVPYYTITITDTLLTSSNELLTRLLLWVGRWPLFRVRLFCESLCVLSSLFRGFKSMKGHLGDFPSFQ